MPCITGASTFLKGWGGASQKVMLDGYKKNGITFDRILLWEAGTVHPTELFGELPPELFHSYQVSRLCQKICIASLLPGSSHIQLMHALPLHTVALTVTVRSCCLVLSHPPVFLIPVLQYTSRHQLQQPQPSPFHSKTNHRARRHCSGKD